MVRAMTAELDTVVRIAREAGAILSEIYAKDFAVAYKSPRDPVTDADRLANAHIVAALEREFPGDAIVAEESADKSLATKGRVWFVDPLDGTKEFIAKNGEFAVMIGLAIDRRASLGVVFQPATGKLYAGAEGVGAFLEQNGERRTLRVSEEADPSRLRLVVSRSHRPTEIDRIAKKLGLTSERPSGSVGLKVGLIAEREADLYIHLSDKSSHWDACAPEAILRAAGGVFVRADGERYAYGGSDLRTDGGILACNAASYEAVLAVVKEVAHDTGFLS
jgi:3'(2'), 5'-bisphosphate nucleotidase